MPYKRQRTGRRRPVTLAAIRKNPKLASRNVRGARKSGPPAPIDGLDAARQRAQQHGLVILVHRVHVGSDAAGQMRADQAHVSFRTLGKHSWVLLDWYPTNAHAFIGGSSAGKHGLRYGIEHIEQALDLAIQVST